MKQQQRWFLAELIFRLHDQQQPTAHHFDKYYFPLHAFSAKEAYQMALIKASCELDNRRDYTKDYLQWEFVGLAALTQIERLKADTAYHQAMKTPDDIPGFVYDLRKQNAAIQLQLTEVV